MSVNRLRTRFLCLLRNLLLWFGCSHAVLAQQRTLTLSDGLPTNSVWEVLQDRAGFIWLVTSEGLVRYDGRACKVFRRGPGRNTLAENNLVQMQFAPDSTLLIQTRTGDIQRFDPVTEQFSDFLPLRRQGNRYTDEIHFTPDGHTLMALWRGQQVRQYDGRLREQRTWTERELGSPIRTLHSLLVASTGKAYGHCDEGIIELTPPTGHHRLIRYPGPVERWMQGTMWSKDWRLVAERPGGELVIIGKHCLLVLNPATDAFRAVPMPGVVSPTEVYGMKVLADGKLYVGINNHLYEFTTNDRFRLVHEWAKEPTARRPYGIPLLLDRSGMYWLLTEADGVTLINSRPQPFRAYPWRRGWQSDVLQGLMHTKPPTWAEMTGENWVRFTGLNGRVWFIDVASLYRCRPGDVHLQQPSVFNRTDSCFYKIALKPDRRGHLWLYGNTKGGLVEADTSGRIIHYWPNSFVPQTFVKPGLEVADLQPLGQSVWLASYLGKGLYQYDLRQKRFVARFVNQPGKANALPTNQLLGLAADPFDDAVLWIGTVGEGLVRFDTRTKQFRTFRQQDGLPNNTIQSLLTDRQGYLWVATERGLVRLDPRSFQLRTFTQADGLQDDTFGFSLATQLPDGRLAFGSRTGLTVFDPAAIREHPFRPPVVLSELRINNIPVEANVPESPLPKPLNALAHLTLDHTQNFLTFTFAALQYNKPGQIQYRYRLTGVNADWVEAGNQTTANYTQLRPGHYTFDVMATNAEGQWNPQVKRLTLTITPPFWATWWAYGLYALVLLGVVYAVVRFRVRQAQQAQAMRLKQQEAEQLRTVDELKTRFFANITHEFRTPLSLILSPVDKLLRNPKHDPDTLRTLTSVQRNGHQLMRLINQLLDLVKLEANTMGVSLARGDMAQFVKQRVELFEPLAEQKGIRLSVDITVDSQERLFDPDKLEKITDNLLSNAFKFTDAGGSVNVSLHTEGQAVELEVADTGIGIPAEKQAHIFDRFYQVDGSRTRAYEGTGIGLALAKELTERMGGQLTVSSELGQGSRFVLRLPAPLAVGHELAVPTMPVAANGMATSVDRAPRQTAPTALVGAGGPLMLVVEDNVELRDFLAEELASTFRVLTAADGQAAWELIQHELPDVVISDVMMPRLDGYALTRLIKQNMVTRHIAVVLLTARAAHLSRLEGLQYGADDYLTKPFYFDELSLRLRNLLERRHRIQERYQQQLEQAAVPFQVDEVEDECLKKLYQYVEARLDNPALSVEDLAEHCNMSRRTLHRKVTTLTGLSPNGFIRTYRLKRATELLEAGHSVSETAYRVGFETPTYFATVFRKTYGQTPSEFAIKQ